MPNILSACPSAMLERVKMFPFEARLCRDCFLGFNASRLDEEELRLIYDNYLYISPMSGIGQTKYEGMVGTLCKYFDKEAELIEIGCSEGYLLHLMSNKGYKRLAGIEPGPQAEQAKALGLNIIRNYFDGNTFKGRTVDGFFLMHVFEHFDDPFSILEHMKEQLAPEGKIVIEVPDFGGYHHQHLFFFNLSFFMTLCRDKGLKIIEENRERGILRVVIVHGDAAGYQGIAPLEKPEAVIPAARKQYRYFNKSVAEMRRMLESKRGETVYWWGAGSSAVVYLNQAGTAVLQDAGVTVVDGDKNKWGMFIPGPNLEVHPFTILENRSVKTLIIASEFHGEILETCRRNNITAGQIMVVQ
jgi:SAM-dependent methyltransferase